MSMPKPPEHRQNAKTGPDAGLDGVFSANRVRHAFYSVRAQYLEMRISDEARKTLLAIPDGLTDALGEPHTLEFTARFIIETQDLFKMPKTKDIFMEIEQKTKAANTLWTRLSQEKIGDKPITDTLVAYAEKKRVGASLTDLKASAYEFFSQIAGRTNLQ